MQTGEQVRVSNLLEFYLRYKRDEFRRREAPKLNYEVLEAALKPIEKYFGDYTVGDITRQAIREFTTWRRDQQSRDGTIRKQLTIFRAALNLCRKEDLFSGDIVAFELPPEPPPREHYLTPEQVKEFMAAEASPHVNLFCLLALHTLSRKGAILGLQWSWGVDFERGRINFNPPGRLETKKRRVAVPMTTTLRDGLLDAQDFATTDFVIEFRGKAVQDIKRGFASKAEAAGMNWVTPHVLRHTGASILAQQGIPLLEIAQIMGDNVRTVEKHYLKFSPDYLKGATGMLERVYG